MAMSLDEFKKALGFGMPKNPSLEKYLNPTQLAAYNSYANKYQTNGKLNYAALQADGINPLSLSSSLASVANREGYGGGAPGVEAYLKANPNAIVNGMLSGDLASNQSIQSQFQQKLGIDSNTWNSYWTDRTNYLDAASKGAYDYGTGWTKGDHNDEYSPLDWLTQKGGYTGDVGKLNDQQIQTLYGEYNTYQKQKESGGFLDSMLPILGTVAGIMTGNPYLGAIAGGLSSGISTGSPLAGLLGAAGGYFGASGVADAGGFMNYVSNGLDSIGNFIAHPIDSITSALNGLTSGFGNTSGSGLASGVNDVAQAANTAHDVLNGNAIPGLSSGVNPVSLGASLGAANAGSAGLTSGLGGISTAAGAGAGLVGLGSVLGSAVTGSNGVLASAGNTAATTGLGSVATGLSGGPIAVGTGALGATGAGVLANATGSTSGGLLGGTTSGLGSTVSGIMQSLFGTGTGTGGLLGSGLSTGAMDLLSGIFGSMNTADLSKLQDAIVANNNKLTGYLPGTQWRDTLLNHLNTIVTNPGQLISSGPYKDYLDQTTQSIERRANAQGYGGVGQSSNTQYMISQGLTSNINDIIKQDYATSVNALAPYFQVGTQGTTNLTQYSNSSLPNSVASGNLGSNQLLANGAANLASGLIKTIFG